MGYLRTIAQIMKQIGKTSPEMIFNIEGRQVPQKGLFNPKARELFNLLDGVTKIPKEEFGRFNKLEFVNNKNYKGQFHAIGEPEDLGYHNIKINIDQLRGTPETFLHELAHARQFSPDQKERRLIEELLRKSDEAAGTTSGWENNVPITPLEHSADKVGKLASERPENFSSIYTDAITDTLKQPFTSRPRVYRSYLNYMKPYSGKGWLWGGAGVAPFMKRAGEENE